MLSNLGPNFEGRGGGEFEKLCLQISSFPIIPYSSDAFQYNREGTQMVLTTEGENR